MKESPAPEDVARRAYELFLSRGGEHGRDLEDWLEAERQVAVGRNTSRHPAAAPPIKELSGAAPIRRWIK